MKKQTAVEFLADKLHGFIHPEHGKDFLPILEKAKAMEKEQIIDAFMNGELFGEEKYASDYYKETYEKTN